jgi:hypothetical protein
MMEREMSKKEKSDPCGTIKKSCVYFLQGWLTTDQGPEFVTKIGQCGPSRMRSRINDIRQKNDVLESIDDFPLYVVEDLEKHQAVALEAYLHHFFSAQGLRVHGEWFGLTAQYRHFILQTLTDGRVLPNFRCLDETYVPQKDDPFFD